MSHDTAASSFVRSSTCAEFSSTVGLDVVLAGRRVQRRSAVISRRPTRLVRAQPEGL